MDDINKSLEYTCILSGGAVRGICYVGAVKALEELGINPKTIAGSSVGAVFAGLMALGYNAEELEEIFVHINFELFRDIHFGFGRDFAISKGEIFLEWLRELIEQKYYGENYKKGENPPVTFKDLQKNLVVITTDLTNFKYKEFSKAETPDFEIAYAIRISSGMPGLMKPVLVENALLVDGDLQKSWPAWKLSKTLYPDDGRVLEFRLEGNYEGEGQNAINYINTVYSCVTSLSTDLIMETYGQKDKFDFIKINTGSVVIVDFNMPKEKRHELMNIGYVHTYNYFKYAIVGKKQIILKHYRALSKQIGKIKKQISSNKIKQAQNQLGLMYMDFCETRKFIDLKYYDMIDDFKDLFMSNIMPPSLFGIHTLKNSKLINTQITLIDVEFEKKVIELESYIFKL